MQSVPTVLAVSAVLFDLDGTLIDSSAAVERSWRTWSERWGLANVFTSHEHGRPARRIVADHLPPEQVDAGFALIESLEVTDTTGIVLLPGAGELLAALPRDRWAVVTSCSRPLAHARLAAVGLEPPVLVTASDTERGKPDPDPFLAAADRLGVPASACLVVEDAPAGIAAARAAGCRSLGVLGTVPELSADVVVPSLTAVSVRVRGDVLELVTA